jgi:hypothetical protein
VIQDLMFPAVDVALRRGRNIDREDGDWYAFIADGVPELEQVGVLMSGILTHIGNTPLVRLEHIGRELPVPVLVKCEHMNPGGSIKDRIALAIVDDAEKRGVLRSSSHPA